MFRALTCPSSGGTTHVNVVQILCFFSLCVWLALLCICWLSLWKQGYQMLCLCSCSSWGWACQGPKHVEDSNVTYMLLLNYALKLGEEIILYYDARSKKHQIVRAWTTAWQQSLAVQCMCTRKTVVLPITSKKCI